MTDVTFESIKPLIVWVRKERNTLTCLFKCPITNERFTAMAYLDRKSLQSSSEFSDSKNSFLMNVRSTIGNKIKKAKDLFSSMEKIHTEKPEEIEINFNHDKQYEESIITAFMQIAAYFRYDSDKRHWVFSGDEDEFNTYFEKQLNNYPVNNVYDMDVLSRMLLSVAHADGTIAAEELNFLTTFLNISISDSNLLYNFKTITKDELENCSDDGTRNTMLMVTWAIALTDESLDKSETEKINQFAEWLNISKEKSYELKHFAQLYVIDNVVRQFFTSAKFIKGYNSLYEIMALDFVKKFAKNIGLTEKDAELTIERIKKLS